MLWSPAVPPSTTPLDLDSLMVDPKLDAAAIALDTNLDTNLDIDIDPDIVDPLASFVADAAANRIDIPPPSIDPLFPIDCGPINDLSNYNDLTNYNYNDLTNYNDSSTHTTPPPSTTSTTSTTSIHTLENNTIEPNILYLSDYDQTYKTASIDYSNPVSRPSFTLEHPTISFDDTTTTSTTTTTHSPILKSQSHDDTHFSSSDIDDDNDFVRINNKKICDSRLSLTQLSIVLNLEGNDSETAAREKNILHILRNDLGFPIGEKTWIRDTPPNERERILQELTLRVESIYNYGYSKKILAIIVRRASYYMMQGRLRRQRRLNRKKSLLAKQQQQQQQQQQQSLPID